MNSTTQTTLRKAINAAIIETVSNPALYLIPVLAIAKTLRLDPARCIPLGVTLDLVVAAVLEEAGKQGRTEADVRAATLAAI